MELDRQFIRRHITWKLSDATRESLKNRKLTPKFSLLLGTNKTEWCVEVRIRDQHLAVYLWKYHSDRQDFSLRFNVAIIKMNPNPTYKHSSLFNGSGEKIFKEHSGYGFSKFISLDILFDAESMLIVDNELNLEMQLELIENTKLNFLMEGIPFLENYEKLVNNKTYADFVIICSDDKKIYAQKSILAAHCEVFATMIGAGLSEAKTNSVTVADIDSGTMIELVRFMYCRKVKNLKRIQAKLVLAANKYGIEDLRILCVSSLMESLTDGNVLKIFDIAELLGEDHLKENCIDYMKCHQYRLQDIFKKDDVSKTLLWALWRSIDLHPIRICFSEKENVLTGSEIRLQISRSSFLVNLLPQ